MCHNQNWTISLLLGRIGNILLSADPHSAAGQQIVIIFFLENYYVLPKHFFLNIFENGYIQATIIVLLHMFQEEKPNKYPLVCFQHDILK